MRIVLFIVMGALALLLVLFGVQNPGQVEVSFLSFNSGKISLSLLVIGAAIVGGVIVGMFSLVNAVQRRVRDRGNKKRINEMTVTTRTLQERVVLLERENVRLKAAASMATQQFAQPPIPFQPPNQPQPAQAPQQAKPADKTQSRVTGIFGKK